MAQNVLRSAPSSFQFSYGLAAIYPLAIITIFPILELALKGIRIIGRPKCRFPLPGRDGKPILNETKKGC